MRVILATLPLLAFLATPVQAGDPITVHLTINASLTAPYDEPAFTASCDLQVADGADGSAVLDAAVAADCIGGWDFTTHPDFGRFLTGITKEGLTDSTDARDNGVRFVCGAFPPPNPGGEPVYSFWGFGLNLGGSPTGLDDYEAADDDKVSFHYAFDTCVSATFLAFVVTGFMPTSPVPIAGNEDTDPDNLL